MADTDTVNVNIKRRAHIFALIFNERERQERLKAEGKLQFTCADPQMLSSEKYLVLAEEVGEVARAVLNLQNYSRDYPADLSSVKEELIQAAAVAVAWLEFIDGLLCSSYEVPIPTKEGKTVRM